MSQDSRIQLQCTTADCRQINYNSKKGKLIKQRLELKKFCRFCKKQTVHKETK